MWVWLHILLKHWSTLELAWCLKILLFLAQAQCAHCGYLLSLLSTKFGSVSHCCDQLTARTERRLFTVQERHRSHQSGGLLTFQRCHCRSFPFFLVVSTEQYCLIMSEAPFPERLRSGWVIENLFLITESFQHMTWASQWHRMHHFTQLNVFVLFELYPGCTLFKGWSHLWLVMNRRSIGDQMSLEEGPLMRSSPLRFCPLQLRRFWVFSTSYPWSKSTHI